MASQLISFRLSDAEIEALHAQSDPDESLNLTAQRILRIALGLSTSVDNTVNSLSLDERIESIVEEKMAHIVNGLNGKLQEFEVTLGKL